MMIYCHEMETVKVLEAAQQYGFEEFCLQITNFVEFKSIHTIY